MARSCSLRPCRLELNRPTTSPSPRTPRQGSSQRDTGEEAEKVWTNDEIGSVKGTVSVVGDNKSSSSSSSSSADSHLVSTTNGSSADARRKQIADYRDRIKDYQDQIDAIDKRISQLKDFKAENSTPTGGINPTQGYNMVPVEDQVKQLDDQKKRLQAKLTTPKAKLVKTESNPVICASHSVATFRYLSSHTRVQSAH